VGQPERDDLRHPQLPPLVKDDVVVNVHNSASALVQQDIVQVAVSQAKQMANLRQDTKLDDG